MKKKIITILLILTTLSLIFLVVNYLFIAKININDMTIKVKTNYNFKELHGKLRNKNIELDIKENVDFNKPGNYELLLKTHEKYALNKTKKINIHVIDDDKPIITLNGKENQIINYKTNYVEEGLVVL